MNILCLSCSSSSVCKHLLSEAVGAMLAFGELGLVLYD